MTLKLLSRLGVFERVARWIFGARIAAVMGLTWKAAFRFRLFLVLSVLLIASVVLLPMMIKDDGTARGFTQILMTYTLSVITALLGLSTLWLACGTLARDVEECQIQMVAVKPIARWQIWLGKYFGILSLNAALLALSGLCVYTLVQWRASRLPADQQSILRNEVLVARGSLTEASLDRRIEAEAEKRFQERLQKNPVDKADREFVRKQTFEQVRAEVQNVPPGGYRPWVIDLGLFKNSLRDRPLYLRVKFNAAEKSPTGTFVTLWQVGPTEGPNLRQEMNLAPDTFHEFEVPPNLFDDQGILTIFCLNPNNTSLVFPLQDGLEVLYREGGFGLNFTRGLIIIFCWMALLAAVGLAAASFLSFPVAAFASLALLAVVLSSGTMATVVSEGSVFGVVHDSSATAKSAVDFVVVPLCGALLTVTRLVVNFSPIDALSTGRSIPWSTLGLALVQIGVMMCGLVAAFGIWAFHRRELATAQGTN